MNVFLCSRTVTRGNQGIIYNRKVASQVPKTLQPLGSLSAPMEKIHTMFIVIRPPTDATRGILWNTQVSQGMGCDSHRFKTLKFELFRPHSRTILDHDEEYSIGLQCSYN
jgi:hypothetical protein